MTNVLSAFFGSSSPKHFVTGLLVHVHLKEKIALEIAVKVANGPIENLLTTRS
jgi:hypothetical protein